MNQLRFILFIDKARFRTTKVAPTLGKLRRSNPFLIASAPAKISFQLRRSVHLKALQPSGGNSRFCIELGYANRVNSSDADVRTTPS
jgi:hypothetical protein